MTTTETIIIGAGQAGLAMSRCLTDRGVDHVVLERGRVAERWRSERWDSLRLLTPNWMSRLPGWSYDGPDPDGFMTAGEVATFFERYARSCDAPIQEQSAVESLTLDGDGVRGTSRPAARGARRVSSSPPDGATARRSRRWLASSPPAVHQLAPNSYRNPSSIPDGGVLVVGGSATGVQLADELRAAGRDVVLAVGAHSRLPRRYRGMDIFWWLERIGTREQDDRRDARPGSGPTRTITPARRQSRRPVGRSRPPCRTPGCSSPDESPGSTASTSGSPMT